MLNAVLDFVGHCLRLHVSYAAQMLKLSCMAGKAVAYSAARRGILPTENPCSRAMVTAEGTVKYVCKTISAMIFSTDNGTTNRQPCCAPTTTLATA
jgi:hypothetical protein